MRFHRIKGVRAALSLSLVGMAAWLVPIGYDLFNDPTNDWWFDAAIWKAQHVKPHEQKVRARMLYDLGHRVLQPGMTRDQVITLLGQPEGEDSPRESEYLVGPWGILGPPDVFFIYFDDKGKYQSSAPGST